MTKRNIITGELFHVLNRGVDKRKIFLDDKDYFRFVHNLFEFNDDDPVFNTGYHFNKNAPIDSRSRYSRKPIKKI